MASLRSHILNAAIRYVGKRRLAGLEFTQASIAATRARLERLGDRNELLPPLLDDSQRLAQRARNHGVDVELRAWHRMPHVFAMFADFIPEGRRALRDIGAFIDARLPRASRADSR